MAEKLPPSIQKIINKKWDSAGDFHREALDPQERVEAAIRTLQAMSIASSRSLSGLPKRRPGAAYCVAIEQATGGAVTRRDLRPTDWPQIWPELAKQEAGHA